MATTVMNSCFSSEYVQKAERVFMRPGNQYSWEAIICGAQVLTEGGTTYRVSAAESNTFRGFYRINKNCPGAQEGFRSYFIESKSSLLERLSQVQNRQQLHRLENDICKEVRRRLGNIVAAQLKAYNKVRKPVDLYAMNLVAMAIELDAHRAVLTPLLFLPLDSQIIRHPELFTDAEITEHGLSRKATYKDVKTEMTYRALQQLLQQRADALAAKLNRPFAPIYFDLVWKNRYKNWGGNLFETNPPPSNVARR